MTTIDDITAEYLIRPELPSHPALTMAVLHEAREKMAEIRKSVMVILDLATRGAKDLLAGNCWSDNIEIFESLSMAQARALATFPVSTNHPELGPCIFDARTAFVAFRETIRREVIGSIHTDMPRANYEETLRLVGEHARRANDSMSRVEMALTESDPEIPGRNRSFKVHIRYS